MYLVGCFFFHLINTEAVGRYSPNLPTSLGLWVLDKNFSKRDLNADDVHDLYRLQWALCGAVIIVHTQLSAAKSGIAGGYSDKK